MNGKYFINDYGKLTINEISKLEGHEGEHEVDERLPLSVWYGRILDKKLADLSDGDIAKLIRQNVHLPHVVPEGIKRIHLNPIAGDLGDFELLEAFNYIDVEEWKLELQLSYEVKIFFIKLLEKIERNELDLPQDKERFSEEDREELKGNIEKTINTLQEALS
ncbi:hypothetical protein B5M42_004900 [Paenibacillus athensensis]|uniref:Uncharacterized protein n=1 Tax=Paenibacillus athensensis TaxID=1967502 RepID=A0A4Y8PXL1_9BACL|nr:contact-dependent growth inhibition system immunity protein [Paenibacillus athensensis]MCD1258177.1 hypothetical protein [Paenibacillus athensensis]